MNVKVESVGVSSLSSSLYPPLLRINPYDPQCLTLRIRNGGYAGEAWVAAAVCLHIRTL